MNIDTGLGIVLVAGLIFYLRLIILQRQRVKQITQTIQANARLKGKRQPASVPPRFSLFSQNKRDWIIAGLGGVAVIFGVLLNAHSISIPAIQAYWWIPTAIGILAFNWAFK